mmetsp:Transcript_38087/g.104838  ORF Transcript_38087/g.104838 Transcript_38087/m.104838 type:complete len:351 (+) Transcript_38087:37-1089(+)
MMSWRPLILALAATGLGLVASEPTLERARGLRGGAARNGTQTPAVAAPVPRDAARAFRTTTDDGAVPWRGLEASGAAVGDVVASPSSLDNPIWQLHRFALAVVLAGGAGIRATVPMFIISLVHLLDPDSMPLSAVTEWLGHWSVCAGFFVFLVVEVLADMIPVLDHALHAILAPIAPIAGALAAVAPTYPGGLAAQLPMGVTGAMLAFVAHSGKAAGRASSTAATGGILNCPVSVGGTVGLVVVTLLAMFAVTVSIVMAAIVVSTCVYCLLHLRKAVRKFRMRKTALGVLAAVRFRRAALRPESGSQPGPLPGSQQDLQQQAPAAPQQTPHPDPIQALYAHAPQLPTHQA